ncbi:MAG: rhodanese-like domain-containing protein, partial [Gammaproteobacteria bacterium]|nr:rhodanese-like domain-containing protein [Gammaproteobacteria bacterium]
MKANYLLKVIFIFLVSSQSVLAEKPLAPEALPGVIRVSAEQAVELIVNIPNLVVIDSRKDIEFSKGHIQGSISLLDTDMTPENLAENVSDKAVPILFYCNGERCMRSSRAATKALEWGYKTVYWFRGGWNEWIE